VIGSFPTDTASGDELAAWLEDPEAVIAHFEWRRRAHTLRDRDRHLDHAQSSPGKRGIRGRVWVQAPPRSGFAYSRIA